MKKSFLVWLISFAATGVFLICLLFGYFTAKNGIQQYIDVRNNKLDVPYSGGTPENFGICLSLPDEKAVLFNLDFAREEILVSDVSGDSEKENQKYSADVSYDLFGEIVDKIGGIVVSEGGEEIRITGVTAAEALKENTAKSDEILPAFIKALCKNGIAKSDFLYILQHCDKTNLSVVDLFEYKDSLVVMLKNMRADT